MLVQRIVDKTFPDGNDTRSSQSKLASSAPEDEYVCWGDAVALTLMLLPDLKHMSLDVNSSGCNHDQLFHWITVVFGRAVQDQDDASRSTKILSSLESLDVSLSKSYTAPLMSISTFLPYVRLNSVKFFRAEDICISE